MRVLAVDVRAQHHEFLTAQTAEHIGAPQPVANAFAHRLQNPIAHGMPVLVVDAFEVVDVEHDHRQLAAATLDPSHFSGQAFLEITAVMNAGQRVRHRQRTQFFLDAFEVGNVGDVAMPQHSAAWQLFRRRLAAHPTQAALGQLHAVFLAPRAEVVRRLTDRSAHPRGVLRMNAGEDRLGIQ